MKINIQISSNTMINAIYFGLALTGYEYGYINKPDNVADMLKQTESYAGLNDVKEFFTAARQNTCEVYPFWPRAALMETATFFINNITSEFDFSKYKNYVYSLQNITPAERNDSLFNWIATFPQALDKIQNDSMFHNMNNKMYETVCQISHDISIQMTTLADKLSKLSQGINTGVTKMTVIICPIKCIYSADYFLRDNEMFVILGNFLPHSVVHEYMHLVVHPKIAQHKEDILSHSRMADIDQSYYLDGNEAGELNAFEEHIVRLLSNAISENTNICVDTTITSELEKFNGGIA